MAWDTAADVINDAAVELGLQPANIADPYSSPDPAILLLCRLLKSVGRRLIRAHEWSQLVTGASFTLTLVDVTYAANTGFHRLVDGTLWNRTRKCPVLILTPVQWQAAVALGWSGDPACRLYGDDFIFYTEPTSADVVGYEYVSKLWVERAGTGYETPEVGTDSLYFDPALLVSGLKLFHRRAKGFDTSHEQAEYDEALEAAIAADKAARPVSMSAGSGKYVFPINLPDTGWGV